MQAYNAYLYFFVLSTIIPNSTAPTIPQITTVIPINDASLLLYPKGLIKNSIIFAKLVKFP